MSTDDDTPGIWPAPKSPQGGGDRPGSPPGGTPANPAPRADEATVLPPAWPSGNQNPATNQAPQASGNTPYGQPQPGYGGAQPPQGPPPGYGGQPPQGPPAYGGAQPPFGGGPPPYGAGGGQPPYGGGGGQPPYGGPPFGGGQPPRKGRAKLFIGAGLALLLVIGLGVTGFLYFTGRLGIGPLSAEDKAAAAAIEDGVDAPEWAEGSQIECAVEELLSDSRSGELVDRGLVKGEGDDWEYTAEWQEDDAKTYFEGVLECSDDWPEQVGEMWELEDTDCLADIGAGTIGAYFAAESLTFASDDDKDSIDEARGKAVEELDECYLEEPTVPTATATPAYRAVKFTFATTDTPKNVTLNTGGAGNWKPVGGSVDVDTDEGGAEGCVDVQAVAEYAWGSTAEAEDSFCGKAKPKRIYWQKASEPCTVSPGCVSWQLAYEGFKDFQSITARYTSNGGDCMASSGRCSDTIFTQIGGRGTIVTWRFPSSYDGRFVAKVGKLSARIRN